MFVLTGRAACDRELGRRNGYLRSPLIIYERKNSSVSNIDRHYHGHARCKLCYEQSAVPRYRQILLSQRRTYAELIRARNFANSVRR